MNIPVIKTFYHNHPNRYIQHNCYYSMLLKVKTLTFSLSYRSGISNRIYGATLSYLECKNCFVQHTLVSANNRGLSKFVRLIRNTNNRCLKYQEGFEWDIKSVRINLNFLLTVFI